MSEKEKACLEVLIEAGCSEEWARGFLSLWKEGKVCEAMRILTERRRELLEKLHTDQRQLDCLDYFIYQMKKKKLEICSEEGKTEMERYIAPLNPKVERTHVRYKNRFGITLAGDLYVAKDMDRAAKHPALVIGAPYGGVKEQGPCVYAGELARRGFVALTFDPSFGGESGGEPRHTSSPEIFPQAWIFSERSLMWTEIKWPRLASAAAAASRFLRRRWISAFGRLSRRACMTFPAYRQGDGRIP